MAREEERGYGKKRYIPPPANSHRDSFTATATAMAFRRVQGTLTPLLLLLCLNLITGTILSVHFYKHFTHVHKLGKSFFPLFLILDRKTEAVNIREKCMCIQGAGGVVWKHVKDFTVIDSGPHCNKVQLM